MNKQTKIVRNHQEEGRGWGGGGGGGGGGFKKFHEMFVLVDIRWECSCKGGKHNFRDGWWAYYMLILWLKVEWVR